MEEKALKFLQGLQDNQNKLEAMLEADLSRKEFIAKFLEYVQEDRFEVRVLDETELAQLKPKLVYQMATIKQKNTDMVQLLFKSIPGLYDEVLRLQDKAQW